MNTSFEFFPPKTEKGKKSIVDLTRKLSNFHQNTFLLHMEQEGQLEKELLRPVFLS